jgi:hypothetical protein
MFLFTIQILSPWDLSKEKLIWQRSHMKLITLKPMTFLWKNNCVESNLNIIELMQY